MKLNELTIKQARKMLDQKEITSVELTKACLARIKEIDDKIKACLTVCEKEALEEAEKADVRIKKGEKGELLGIPYLAKDVIMTSGVRTTAASKILENYIAPYDATVIKKLREAGAILLGKTNLDEFAQGSSTENSAFFTTRNPWDLSRVAGGTSGGSAAGVVADMCLFALGTDTGGSVRCPASFCGITGIKPTYGRISRFGLMAITSSTDVPGVLAKTAEDTATVLKILAGKNKHDATTPDVEVSDYDEEIKKDLKGLRIGIPAEYFGEGLNGGVKKSIEQAIEKLEELGVTAVPISLPHSKYVIATYYIINTSEISSNLAKFDGIRFGYSDDGVKSLYEVYTRSRGKGFGAEVKRRIMLGTYALSAGYYDAYYLKAQKVRTKIKEELDYELSKVDAIITPVQPTPAFKIGENSSDPLKMYLEDIYVGGVSLSGLPAVSAPCGFVDGLPVSMQIIGKRFDEATILRLAHQYEMATEWGNVKPQN